MNYTDVVVDKKNVVCCKLRLLIYTEYTTKSTCKIQIIYLLKRTCLTKSWLKSRKSSSPIL